MEHKFSWNYLPNSTCTHTYYLPHSTRLNFLLTTFHEHILTTYNIPHTHTSYLPHSTHAYFLFTTFHTHILPSYHIPHTHTQLNLDGTTYHTPHTHTLTHYLLHSTHTYFFFGNSTMVPTMCKPTDLAGWSLIPLKKALDIMKKNFQNYL